MNHTSVSNDRPDWLKIRAYNGNGYNDITALIRKNGLHTVCQESKCPNIFECYDKGTATFLILGNRCSRRCSFCNIAADGLDPVIAQEPENVAEAVSQLGLNHVVITSVTRDDLHDGGAAFFAETVSGIKNKRPGCIVELLIPDFQGDKSALKTVFSSGPDIIAHNLETVKRLYPLVRPAAHYRRSLGIINSVKEAGIVAKTGIMVGLGERLSEVIDLMTEAKNHDAEIFNIGQYLSPSPKHAPVLRYYSPAEFAFLRKVGYEIGFDRVVSGPLVRSSYRYQSGDAS